MLSKAQVDQFWENGFVIAENGATVEQLNELSIQLDAVSYTHLTLPTKA